MNASSFSLAATAGLIAAFSAPLTAQIVEAELLQEVSEMNAKDVRGLIATSSDGAAIDQLRVAFAFQHGYGVAQNPGEAAAWFHRAAEQGAALGQYHYALMCLDGAGVAQDPVEAFRWFGLAADQGSLGAQTYVGIMYVNGLGVAADPEEGFRYLDLAGRRGSPMAHANLGAMYANGVGVERDPHQALMWLLMAQRGGFEGVQPIVDDVQRPMSAGEIAEAQRLATERFDRIMATPTDELPTTLADPAAQPPAPVDPETQRRVLGRLAQWMSIRLTTTGTFTMTITDDWSRVEGTTFSGPANIEARHETTEQGLANCTLYYRDLFLINAADVRIDSKWYIPLDAIDLESARIRPYELPIELRVRNPRTEVFLRALADREFIYVTPDDTRYAIAEHGIPLSNVGAAEQLLDLIRAAAGVCGAP